MNALRVVLVVMMVGCGAGSDPAAAFAGTWRFDAGSTRTFTCTGNTVDLTGGEFTIVQGAAADLEMPSGLASAMGCKVTFTLDGRIAEADDMQACTIGLGGSGCTFVSGVMVEYPFTLELGTGDATLVVDQMWRGLVGTNGCSAQQCSGAVTGTATKVNGS